MQQCLSDCMFTAAGLIVASFPCMQAISPSFSHYSMPVCNRPPLLPQHCRDCSSPPNYIPGLPWVFTLLFGLALVVGIVWLNFGLSPTLDSLLFFVQVCNSPISSALKFGLSSFLVVNVQSLCLLISTSSFEALNLGCESCAELVIRKPDIEYNVARPW